MKIIPQNNYVACTLDADEQKTTESGIVYKSDDVKVYEIVAVPESLISEKLSLQVGDKVIVNSTGTKFETGGVVYYMFNIENIMGKVI